MIRNFNPKSSKEVIKFLNDDLFIYWRVESSKELDDYWKNYISKNNHLRNDYYNAIKEFESIKSFKTEDLKNKELVKLRIEESIKIYKKKTRNFYFSISAIAATLLILVTSTILTINFRNNATQELVVGKITQNNEIQLYAGKQVVNINNNSTLDFSQSSNTTIIQDSLSQKSIQLADNKINKLVVPFGRRSTIILADGSKVWLNSGTEIEFPSDFKGNTREIKIKGEIFIDVVKQNQSFIIHTPQSQIKVFGTSFNVSAYTDEAKESVVLVEGSVQIQSRSAKLLLSPNQLAEIENGNIKSQNVNVSDYISWKSGFMQLNKMPLDEVLRKIGRYYNVEFRYNEDLKISDKTCSGKLFLSDDIRDVLKAFTEMTLLKYEEESDKIINIKN